MFFPTLSASHFSTDLEINFEDSDKFHSEVISISADGLSKNKTRPIEILLQFVYIPVRKVFSRLF